MVGRPLFRVRQLREILRSAASPEIADFAGRGQFHVIVQRNRNWKIPAGTFHIANCPRDFLWRRHDRTAPVLMFVVMFFSAQREIMTAENDVT